jgi:hypothetical protein
MPGDDEEGRVFRPGGVSYLHIPAPDPARSAAFYRAAFAWNIRDDEDSPAFEDGAGHVIGTSSATCPSPGTPVTSPTCTSSPSMRPSPRSRPTAARSSALRSQRATCRSRQSTIPPGTCLASGSGDHATDDVIPGVQNRAICARRLMTPMP